MNSINRHNVKMYAAVFGGSAVVALGALSTAIVQQQSGAQDLATTGASVSAITSSTPAPAAPAEESVMSAAPQVKASTEYWPGESPNHVPV